jgi:hypothetical protein
LNARPPAPKLEADGLSRAAERFFNDLRRVSTGRPCLDGLGRAEIPPEFPQERLFHNVWGNGHVKTVGAKASDRCQRRGCVPIGFTAAASASNEIVHQFLVSVVVPLGLIGADRPAAASDPCLTPQGTLCRTIRWEGSGWENRSWGFHAIERWRGSTTLSYRRDGAWIERNARRTFRNYVVSTARWDVTQIKVPDRKETIELDNASHEFEIRPGVRGGVAVWDSDDPDCAKLATKFELSELTRLGEVMIAGVRAIEYRGKRSATRRITVALAPSLGCTQLRSLDRDYNRLGLPTSWNSFEAVEIRVGEPDPTLFEIPKGYRPKQKR